MPFERVFLLVAGTIHLALDSELIGAPTECDAMRFPAEDT